MIFYVIIGFFAAVGLLFLLWLLRGFFLPVSGPHTVALYCRPEETVPLLRRYRWMRDLGLIHSRVILLESHHSPQQQSEITQNFPGVTFQTPEQWLEEIRERLEANG